MNFKLFQYQIKFLTNNILFELLEDRGRIWALFKYQNIYSFLFINKCTHTNNSSQVIRMRFPLSQKNAPSIQINNDDPEMISGHNYLIVEVLFLSYVNKIYLRPLFSEYIVVFHDHLVLKNSFFFLLCFFLFRINIFI